MINKIKASLELSLLVLIMSLFIIGLGVYGVFEIKKLNNSSHNLYADRMLPMDQLGDIRYYSTSILSIAQQANIKQITFSEARIKVGQAQDSIDANWKAYKSTYLTPAEKQIADKTSVLLNKSNSTIEKLKRILEQEEGVALKSIIDNELFLTLNPVLDEVSVLLKLQVQIGRKIHENALTISDTYLYRFLFILLAVFVFAIPFAYYLIKKNSTIISDFNLSTDQLIVSETNYRNTIEYAGESILILDEVTHVVDVNDMACELFGYSREELLQMKIAELIAPEELKNQVVDIEKVKKSQLEIYYRRIKRKDGTELDVEITNRLMDNKGFFSIIRDITERKESERILKESEEKYRYLFDNNPACIVIWDLETLKNLEVNESTIEKYGYTREEWKAMTIFDFRPKEDYQKIKNVANEILHNDKSKTTSKRVWRHLKKNGEEILMEITTHKIVYNGHQAILGLGHDVTKQVKAEAKLAEREAQLNLFIEHSPAALAMLDNEMRYIATSHRWMSDYNLGNQNIIGKSHYEVFPDINDDWKAIHNRCLGGAIEKNEEDLFVRSDGSIQWVRWEIRPWHKATGIIGGIIMFTEIITERKKATEMFKNQFENAPDLILYINKDLKIEAINRDSPEFKKEELVGMDCILILPEESQQFVRDRVIECFETGKNQEFENILSGGRFARSRLVPLLTDGKVTNIVVFSTDITEQKKAEKQLLESEEKHRVLTENISDAILLLNKNFEIEYQSPSAKRISGFGPEDAVFKSVLDFVHPDETEKAISFMKKSHSSPGITLQNQFRIINKQGEILWIEGNILNLLEDRNIEGYIINYRDITNRKKAENELIHYNDELKKTNSELDSFVYSASHDLRAPLKSMLGLISVTKGDVENDEILIDRLSMLENSVLKLDDFIEDILNYSRNARVGLEKDEIDFEKMVYDIRNNHKFMDDLKDLDIRVEIESNGKFISDRDRINVIFNNIFSNAIKYRDCNKKNIFVNISITYNATSAIIVVEDNGIGISSKNKDKIFNMFYRATTVSTGSGLGLYIVKETIAKLEGKIDVESELGKGTKLIVEIPNQIDSLN